MVGDGSASLPPVGQTGRLHVAGNSVPVRIDEHVPGGARLAVTEEGWTLTDGAARLTYDGEHGAGLLTGRVHVRSDGVVRFVLGPIGDPSPTDPEVGQRRESFRVPLVSDVSIATSLRTVAGHTINVSNTGCLVRCDGVEFREGERVRVTFALEAGTLDLAGVVRRAQAGHTGVMFVDVDGAQERRLSAYLAARQRQLLRRR